MKKYTTIAILLLGFILNLGAQTGFERTYPGSDNESFQVLDGAVVGEGYVILATLMPDVPGESEALFLASFDNKGDELWSRKIEFSEVSQLLDIGSLIVTEMDSIYVSAIIDGEEGSPYRMLSSFDQNGRLGSTRILSDGEDVKSEVVNVVLADHITRNYLLGSTISISDSLGINISRFTYDSSAQWTKEYLAFDTMGNNLPADLRNLETFTIDSSTTMAGNVLSDFVTNPYITKLDTNGNVMWSRKYMTEETLLLNMADMVESADSSFAVVGNIGRNGYAMALDSAGNVAWAKRLDLPDTLTTVFNQITINSNGSIVCAGVAASSTSDSSFAFSIILDGGGNVISQHKYPRTKGFQTLSGEMQAIGENGETLIFGTSSEYGDNINVPQIIKIDENGMTICEDTLSGLSVSDLAIIADTLVWKMRDDSLTFTELEGDDNMPITLDIPVLALNVRPFCPNEPIDWTFDPNVQGAIAYLWSDGSMADTLRVFEEGEYSVTVTVDESVCFTMCDTAMLTVYELPSLQGIVDYSQFCEDGSATVVAQYTGEAPLDSIRWSTGEEDVTSIRVLQEGQYSVTMTDQCQETADTTMTVDFPDLISEIELILNEDFCANNGILLSVTADADISSYTWSTGSVQEFITVTTGGTYSVTITDFCGNPFTDNIEVDPDLIKTVSNVQIATSGGLNCVLNELDLTVTFQGPAQTIEWNTGDTGESITVDNPGTYTVVVTNECGSTLQASIDITECPECLEYPRAFFPRGEEVLNQTFGPSVNCGDAISNYEFKVYNRWGQQVFETTNINEEWDGQHNGNDAPSGVYVFFAKYDIGVGEQMIEGDVTLIR